MMKINKTNYVKPILLFIFIILTFNLYSQKFIDGNKIFFDKYSDTFKLLNNCLSYGMEPRTKAYRLRENKNNTEKFIFIDRKKGKYGILGAKGTVLQKPKFDFFKQAFYTEFAFGYKNNCWYVFGDSLRLISACEYDDFDCTQSAPSYLIVKKNNQWGIINSKNKIIVPVKYDILEYVEKENILKYEIKERYGLMSPEGKTIYETDIPFEYKTDYRLDKINCKYIVRNSKIGIIAKNDTILIEPKYDSAVPLNSKENPAIDSLIFLLVDKQKAALFFNKKIIVPLGKLIGEKIRINKEVYLYEEEGKKGVIRLKNDKLTKFKAIYDDIKILPPQFAGPSIEHLPIAIKQYDKYGVIDNYNNIILDAKFDSIFLYNYEFNQPRNQYTFIAKKYGKFGIINDKNKVLYDYSLTEISPLDRHHLFGKKNGKFGLLNTNGKVLHSFDLDSIKNIKDLHSWRGLDYFFGAKNGKYGMLNKQGVVLLDFTLSSIKKFNRDYFIGDKNGRYGIFNKIGDIILDFKYSEIRSSGSGFYLAKKDKNYGLVNSNGEVVYDFVLTEVKKIPSYWNFKIKKTNKYGLIDSKGNLLLDFEYDDIINLFKSGKDNPLYAIAEKNNKIGLINLSYTHPKDHTKIKELEKILKNKYSTYLSPIITIKGKTEIPFEYDTLERTKNGKIILTKDNKYSIYSIETQKYIKANLKIEDSKRILLYGEKGKIVLKNKND